jgi:hypothetical protein
VKIEWTNIGGFRYDEIKNTQGEEQEKDKVTLDVRF